MQYGGSLASRTQHAERKTFTRNHHEETTKEKAHQHLSEIKAAGSLTFTATG
jgi:hypothetical protein